MTNDTSESTVSDSSTTADDAFSAVSRLLLAERNVDGWWTGELSTSALSTATAVMALNLAAEAIPNKQTGYSELVSRGLEWLAEHQNTDGGWGDTILSISNISTTMLVNAVFHATGTLEPYSSVVQDSQTYIDQAGGVDAVIQRYGKDRTFSVPILTHCALAGTVEWNRVIPLPFELACVPRRLYAAVRMPVVSYALPALIAIGQVIFRNRGHWNPLVRLVRNASIQPSLKILESIQPENGGFLEATPLTSFVCMSLLGCGYHDHIVTERCLSFIEKSVRQDGSWPIDTNLTTWVTTLSVNAMAGSPHTSRSAMFELLDSSERSRIRQWLLDQQYTDVHPYTNSPPGGWSWTNLPGGVPDADDTPGAMIALLNLRSVEEEFAEAEVTALENAAVWLLDLQNRNGGWPTFCRGWGTLPFDRSSNDLTAHVLRALAQWQSRVTDISPKLCSRTETAIAAGVRFLESQQRDDGTWLPLWFGHQHNQGDENPLYGTAKVVLALNELGMQQSGMWQQAVQWLTDNQNSDGSWSARHGLSGSVEETSLALECLAGIEHAESAIQAGIQWLMHRVKDKTVSQPSPIGFYFAKLWYFEKLYPLIFATGAINRCREDIT